MPLPQCATRHKLGTQTYKGQAGRQIATLFARPARFERSSGKAATLVGIHWSVHCAWIGPIKILSESQNPKAPAKKHEAGEDWSRWSDLPKVHRTDIFSLWFQGLVAAGMPPCKSRNRIACASSDEHRGRAPRDSDRSAAELGLRPNCGFGQIIWKWHGRSS